MRVFLPIAAFMLLSLVMSPIPWGDSAGSVFGPISFLCEGNWDFDEFPFLYEQTPRGLETPDPLRNVHPGPDGTSLFSFTGLGVKLLHLPMTALVLVPWTGTITELAALRANQGTVLLTCLSILLLSWGVFRHELGTRRGDLALLALFFGTTLWPQTRQTLWSNQASLLGVVGLLWAVVQLRRVDFSHKLVCIAGVSFGWAVMTRPATLLLCLPLLAVLVWEHWQSLRPKLPTFLLAGLPFLGLFLWDNQTHTGLAWRPPFLEVGSAISARMGSADSAFSGGLWSGLTGSLLSPSRGLLVFSPFLILAPLGALAAWRTRDALGIAMAAGAGALLLLNASYTDWWGAACWGPRRLMEALPFLVLLSFQGARDIPKKSLLLGMLLSISVAVQAVGFFFYDSGWDAEREPTQQLQKIDGEFRYASRETANEVLWSWTEGPIPDALSRGHQFGLENRYSLASGSVVPAPIPDCSILRTVDRYPPESPQTRSP
jgi:hypothetical protein